jgi:arginyl-tRNA synthetase
MKHKVETLSKEKVIANRSNAYEFINFDKQDMEQTSIKKETSIDWLMAQLYKKGFIKEVDGNEPINLMNQAKEMEKQQIIDAWEDGCYSYFTKNSEQYYNETFKNK